VIAMVLFLVGISLLIWAFAREWRSRLRGVSFAKTFRASGVWDQQLDG
jgi:hypothetical protein